MKKQNVPFQRQIQVTNLFSPCQITENVILPITSVGKNLNNILKENISALVEGRCIVEGYVKPHSVDIITYTSGLIKGSNVIFNVVFNCEVCFPVSGMNLNCVATSITKAGIKATSADIHDTVSPFVVHVARDHFYDQDKFNAIVEGSKFTARVIGQRFELNDKCIGVIAELV